MIPLTKLDTPLTFEDMEATGSGLGAAGFWVFDNITDLVAVAQGCARFLAVESCGQCVPCKRDGLAIADLLERVRDSVATETDLTELQDRLETVTEGARCSLAAQQQRVVGGILRCFPDQFAAHLSGGPAAESVLVAPVVAIEDGRVRFDQRQATKQPDWSHDEIDSGAFPAARLGDTPLATPAGSEPEA